jgi:mRNA-degrading endonuclease toxin of MazEF toxin-antitoxin module
MAAIARRRRGLGSEVPIEAPEGGLDQDSVVLAYQLRTVSHERLDRRRGQVTPETLDAVLAISQRRISRPGRSFQ